MVIKRQMTREKEIVSLGESLSHISAQKTIMEAQEKLIRESLFSLMKLGETFPIEDAGIYYKLEKYEAEITVMKSPGEIRKMVDEETFMKLVAITMGRIKEEFGKDHAKFIVRYDKEPKVRLMKDKEKNKG